MISNFIKFLNVRLAPFLFFLFFLNLNGYAQNQVFTVTEDAQVYESDVTKNYGTSADLLVKIQSPLPLSRYSYVKFDLSAYQLNQVGKAVVRLYCRNKANASIDNLINALEVSTNSWSEATLNYSNKPATGAIIASTRITDIGKYYEWDITDYIKSLNISSSSNTIVSIAFSETIASNNTVTFNSKEATENTPPQLIIDETSDPSEEVTANVYYVDSYDGNDNNDGLSEATAWRSLEKVNTITYAPGSKILLKRGGMWIGQLMPKGSGTASKPIIIDSYGGVDDPKPLLNGNGVIASGVIKLYNQAFWEIKNLEIINDATFAAERRGVEITAANYGLIEHIYLINLDIHDIKGTIGSQMSDKKSAGIYFTVEDDAALATRYNDILIEGCLIYNCQNQGIVTNNELSVDIYPRTAIWERRKITNLIVRNNTIHHISKNAMIIRLADGGLVERNLCYETALDTTGNTMFSRSSINTIFQYNEGYLNRSPSYDGSMYDPDLNSPGVIFQYSYSHDNAHGLLWVCTSLPDTGVVARYNISRADKGSLIHFAFDAMDVRIYNNTFYIPAHLNPVIIEEFNRYSHKYVFHNNIIYNERTTTPLSGRFIFAASPTTIVRDGVTLTTTQERTITDNIFYRTTRPSQIDFVNSNLVSDPLLVDPGSGSTGLNSVGGYKLKPFSPALNNGKIIPNNGSKDYFGIAVSSTTKPNIGFYNGPGTYASAVDPNFHIYLLTGQSNMSGRGPLANNIDVSNPRVKLLTKAGTWVTATHPLHAEVEPNNAAVGPGLAFALKMLEGADPNITIGLVATAVGGQNIAAFGPGIVNSRTGLSIYDESVSQINFARTEGVLKGILFHQGESNNNSTASSWPDSVKKLINNFRVEFNDPNLPFILGEMGRFPTSPNAYSTINNVMPRVKNEVQYTDIVSSAGLLAMDVTTHFDSPSATELGIRYAAAMKNLLSTLPIQLLSFKGKAVSEGVLLSWQTISEKNNSMFVIERSNDGKVFTEIAEVKGAGDSNILLNYSYTDKLSLLGNNYYRLKQVDYDGSESYAGKIIIVTDLNLSTKSNLLLAPNPVKDILHVYLKDVNQEDVIVSIYDLNGKQISKRVFESRESIQCNMSDLKDGIYIVEVINANTSSLIGRDKVIKD